jgi:stress response protein YsnF
MNVIDKDGLQGVIAHEVPSAGTPGGWVIVDFGTGRKVAVPVTLLIQTNEGHYRMNASVAGMLTSEGKKGHILTSARQGEDTFEMDAILAHDGDQVIVPVIEESVNVETRWREEGVVEIRKTVHEHIEIVDPPLASEEVEIERVAVNRIVDAPVPVRQEDDTTIIPLLEEVYVVEKRLMLREEVYIKKLRKVVHNPQEVLLKNEQVEIARKSN